MIEQTLDTRIHDRAVALGFQLHPAKIQQLTRYCTLLARWNRHINLTALELDGFPDVTIDRLLMEPLVASASLPCRAIVWFDFGSGGGSPAVPMKICCPETQLVMVESRERKAAFLREVIREVQLIETTVFPGRVEELPASNDGIAELVTVRALGLTEELVRRADDLLVPGGTFAQFGTGTAPGLDGTGLHHTRTVLLPTPGSALHLFQKEVFHVEQ